MLRLPKTLLFPTINRVGETQFKAQPSTLKTGIYKLEWAKIDEIKTERWKEQFPVNPPPVPFCGTLPDTLKSWVDDLRFALSEEYLQEIRHCSMKAAEEWDRKRPVAKHGVDPAVGPAISYVDTAFHLLADCLYDSETNYYSRSGIKLVAPFVLAARFWSYQTTPANVKTWVNLSELQQVLAGLKTEDAETYTMGIQACLDLESHFRLLVGTHYTPKIEEVKPAANEILDDFLSNKVAAVTLRDKIVNIPGFGEIFLSYPVNLRRSRGKITLKAEFRCKEVQKMQDLFNYTQPFDFYLQDKRILFATEAVIKNVSSTPPPEITIEIGHMSNREPKVFKEPEYEPKEVREIDMQKIKKACEQEVLVVESE